VTVAKGIRRREEHEVTVKPLRRKNK